MTRLQTRLTLLTAICVCLSTTGCSDSDGGSDGGDSSAAVASTTASPLSVVSAETDRDLYTPNEIAVATFSNESPEPRYLPGCAPFEFEQRLDGVWTAVGPPFVCVWEGIAVFVDEGERIETDFDVPLESGLYRLRYDYSTGCEQDLPLSEADCERSAIVYSNEFEIVRLLCDPRDFGCRHVPGAPNVLCGDGINFSGPSSECTIDPLTEECGYEFLSCP